MLQYIIKRVLLIVPILIGVSIVAFLLVHLIPGDPARVMLGERATPQAIAELRAQMGLDRPLPEQYLTFLDRIVHGDLGRSVISHNPVATELRNRYPATIELALAAMFVALIAGIPAGIMSAAKPYSVFDHTSMLLALVGVSMPIFWLGLMLIWFGALELGWFPPSGRLSVWVTAQSVSGMHILDSLLTLNWAALKDAAWHLVMPAIALGSIPMAIIARMTRSSMLEVLRQDYIRTAHAKGVAKTRVVLKHALKNALIPVVTVIGLEFGSLLGGAILTETIFSWPGVGRMVYDGVMNRDFPIVQGTILIISSTYVVINLVVDIVYAYLDPRIRYS